MNTDIKMWSAVTLPVVKLVSASWTQEMTGVILYFANRHLILCWHPLKSSSLSNRIQPAWMGNLPSVSEERRERAVSSSHNTFIFNNTCVCLNIISELVCCSTSCHSGMESISWIWLCNIFPQAANELPSFRWPLYQHKGPVIPVATANLLRGESSPASQRSSHSRTYPHISRLHILYSRFTCM